MIKIIVELTSAIDGHKEILGEAKICNDGTGTKTNGNYSYELKGKSGHQLKHGKGKVKNFKRKQNNVWKLIYEVLNNHYNEYK
jgi:hypothetical protein